VVTISGKDFEELITQHPEVRRSLAAEAEKRLKANADQLAVTRTVELGEFLDQGLIQAQSLLVLDLERCTRCDECVRACADSHDGVTRLIRDGLRFDKYLVATSCRSCLDPVCMIGCPVGSIRRNATREIVIEDWCIGCDLCAKNCPYGNINMHPFEVAFDSQLFAKQQPMRQVRAKLSPLPGSIDVTAMPEGLAYDERGGYLVYTNVPDEKRTKELRAFNPEPAYQQAVERLLREMETRVPLPIFPGDFKPAKGASAFVRYDEAEKSLVFLGVIGPEEKDEYKAFSTDDDYKRAVDAAAKKSYAKKAFVTKATTCDLCESLKQEPNCVYACPHEAAKRVEPKKFFRPLLRGQGGDA
jgi:Fe-S-cluster-containing hydrogenase component 2